MRSCFHDDLITSYPGFVGQQVATNAVKELRSIGIDPNKLTLLAHGGNTRVYGFDGIIIKVGGEVSQNFPIQAPQILPIVFQTTLGYDMGSCPIELSIQPQLDTEKVTPLHAQALCAALAKQGLLFHDNKLTNIGLSADGTPYVIDHGAVIHPSTLSPLEKPYLYPALSNGPTDHNLEGFNWPRSPEEIGEFQKARQRIASASASLA